METIYSPTRKPISPQRPISRRELLQQASALSVGIVVGAGFLAAPNAAWALDVKHLKPQTMAVLLQMARDIYPHDKIGDEYYAIAVKGYDDPKTAKQTEAEVAKLNKLAGGSYLNVGWEKDRAAILQKIESTPFFQSMRGGLVTGLYNQKAVWPTFGYEGESYSQGGYLYRGFDDINWL